MVDAAQLEPPPPSPPRIVVTIHGIRTFGQWQTRLAELLTKTGVPIQVETYYYGYFSILAFIIPIFRWIVVRRFRERFRALVRSHPGAEFAIVAHSFGTHIAAWGLSGLKPEELPSIHRLVLAGSVLRSDFNFERLLRSEKVRQVVNDCGTDDNVLLLSQLFILFTGMAGRVGFYGFTSDEVINRFHPGGHSHYFIDGPDGTSPFMEKYWTRLLTTEDEPLPGEPRATGGVLTGIGYALMQVADPLKLSLYGSLILLAAYFGYIQPRQMARLEAQRSAFESAAGLLGADVGVPEATGALAALAEDQGLSEGNGAPRARELLRYALQRLKPLPAVLEALPALSVFRWRDRVYLKGDGLTVLPVEEPIAHAPLARVHAAFVVDRAARAYVFPAAKGEPWSFDFKTQPVIDPDMELWSLGSPPDDRLLILRVLQFYPEDEDREAEYLAIDTVGRRWHNVGAAYLHFDAGCQTIAVEDWDNDDDEEAHILPVARLPEGELGPQETFDSEVAARFPNGLEDCGDQIAVGPLPSLGFPASLAEAALWQRVDRPASTDTGEAPLPDCTDIGDIGGDGLTGETRVDDVAVLDFSTVELAAVSPDYEGPIEERRERMRDRFVSNDFCAYSFTANGGAHFLITLNVDGLWTGSWDICRLDGTVVQACRTFSFSSEGGGRMWQSTLGRHLILKVEDEGEDEGATFRVIDLSDLSGKEPDRSPTMPILAGVLDDATDTALLATRIPSSDHTYRLWLYRNTAAPTFVTSRTYESGGTVPASDQQPGPVFFAKSDGIVAFLPPQSLRGLAVGQSGIVTRWSLPTLGFEGEPSVHLATNADGSLIAANTDAALRLVDGGNGRFLTRGVGFAEIGACLTPPQSVSVSTKDAVTVDTTACRFVRDAPLPADALNAMLGLLPERLGVDLEGLDEESPLLPGATIRTAAPP